MGSLEFSVWSIVLISKRQFYFFFFSLQMFLSLTPWPLSPPLTPRLPVLWVEHPSWEQGQQDDPLHSPSLLICVCVYVCVCLYALSVCMCGGQRWVSGGVPICSPSCFLRPELPHLSWAVAGYSSWHNLTECSRQAGEAYAKQLLSPPSRRWTNRIRPNELTGGEVQAKAILVMPCFSDSYVCPLIFKWLYSFSLL